MAVCAERNAILLPTMHHYEAYSSVLDDQCNLHICVYFPLTLYIYIYIYIYIQGVSGGKVNILGDCSMDYSE
jgi:hypothetical protein